MATTISELYIAFQSNLAKAQDDAASLIKLGDAAEVADTKVTRLGRSGASVARQFDETTRAESRLSREIRQRAANVEALQKALAAGEITQTQYAGALAGIAKSAEAQKEKFDAATGASKQHSAALAEGASVAKLSSYQIGILASEAHKFADQVIAGGGAMKAAFYQVPNMVTVMGGFGKAVEIVGGLLMGPAGIALAAVAAGAAIYKMGSAAESEDAHLASLGQTLRATRSDYAAMAGAAEDAARRISARSGLSLDDSRAVTTTFSGIPTVSGGSLDGLATTARNLAAVLGKDVPEAAKELASAFDDPAKAAEDFAQKGMLGVHESLVLHVKDLQESGDRMGAWSLLMDQLNKATANAADQGVTPFRHALHELRDSLSESFSPLGQFVNWLGEGVSTAALKGVQGMQFLLDKAKQVREWQLSQLERIPGVRDYFQSREGSPSAIGKTIDSVGANLGANNDVIALAHRIQPAESATGQYDPSGSVVQSSAGALGAMQVMPGNANGNDLRTPTGNVTAAIQLLTRLYDKYDGNQALVAMAYNWGEGNVDQYLSGKIATPPQSVATYAQQVTGGEVFGAQALASRQGRVDDQVRGEDGSIAAQLRDREQAITALTAAQKALNELHNAGKVSDADYADQTEILTDKINGQRGAINELRDPLQALAHQQAQAAQSAETYSAAEASMVQVSQQVEEAARRMGQAHATAAQLAEAEARQQEILTGQFNQSVAAINLRSQAEQDLLAGYNASKGSLTQYQQAMQAAEKVRATSIDGTAEQARQLDILTNSMKAATASHVDMANAGKLYSQSLDLDVIKAQTAALGENNDAVSVQIAVMKERNRILEAGGDINSKTSQAYLDNVATIQAATNAYQNQRQALSEVTSGMENIANTLTNSVTQAFVQGGKGAVSFGSILSGLQTQIVGFVAKLALVNPAMNAIDGGSRTTLGSVGGILGKLGGASGSASDPFAGFAGMPTDGSSPFGGTGIDASSVMGVGSALGVGKSTGMISGLLGTHLFGSATIGGALGGIGGGMALGSIAGSLGGGTKGKLGSAVGSVAGAAIGSIIPGVGTIIGGLIGGLIGGGAGGLFGHKKNPYTIDQVMLENDRFNLGATWNQAQDDKITEQLKAELASLNGTMEKFGLRAENAYLGTVRDDQNNKDPNERSVSLKDLLGNVRLRSDDNPTFSQALAQGLPAKFDSVASFQSAIAQLKGMTDAVDALGVSVSKFNSDGTVTVSGFTKATGDLRTALDTMLNGKTVATSELQAQVATITEFVSNTMPGLLKATLDGQQSWVERMRALEQTYKAAADQANSYGLNGAALNDKYNALYRQGYDQNMRTLADAAQGYRGRYLSATGNEEGASLINFDLSATQQRRQLDESWKSFLGDAYSQNQTYLQQVADLNKTLNAERLAIEKRYADERLANEQRMSDLRKQKIDQIVVQDVERRNQASSSAASIVSGLIDFGKGLSVSDYSPLSAEAQYRAANDNFSDLSSRAQRGDYEALQSLRSASQTLLTQSRSYNGSGQDYAADYARVQQVLQAVGSLGANTITESALKAMLSENNQTLASLLQKLLETANKSLAEQRHQAQSRAA